MEDEHANQREQRATNQAEIKDRNATAHAWSRRPHDIINTARRGFKSHATRAVTASLARFELFSATRPRQGLNAPAVCQIALSVGQIGHSSRLSAFHYGNLIKRSFGRQPIFLNAVTFAGRLNRNKWRALAGRAREYGTWGMRPVCLPLHQIVDNSPCHTIVDNLM